MITKIAKKVLAVVLAVAMSVPLYVPAIAESFWDGQGSSASSGSQSAGANALFSMKGTVGENFIGYRLTAYRLTDGYDKDGENVSGEIIEGGHPIEVFFGTDDPKAKQYTLEKNLTGTNRTYGSGTSLTPSYEFCATIGATGYEYSFDKYTPSLVGPVTNGREHNVDVWVNKNRTYILNYCGVRGDEENYLISVEPLFRASIAVEGTSGLVPQVRVGTVHDFAEYQKGFYGEGPVNTSNQTGASSRYYSFIAVNLGARYLKTLYCDDKNYTLGDNTYKKVLNEPDNMSNQVLDEWINLTGTNYAYNAGAKFNPAKEIISHAVGLGVYVQTMDGTELNKYTITYHANAPSGQTVTGVPAQQTKYHGLDIKLSEDRPVCGPGNYVFAGWAEQTFGIATYEPGDIFRENRNLDLYAIWKEVGANFTIVRRLDGELSEVPDIDLLVLGDIYANPKGSEINVPLNDNSYWGGDLRNYRIDLNTSYFVSKDSISSKGSAGVSISGYANEHAYIVIDYYTVEFHSDGGISNIDAKIYDDLSRYDEYKGHDIKLYCLGKVTINGKDYGYSTKAKAGATPATGYVVDFWSVNQSLENVYIYNETLVCDPIVSPIKGTALFDAYSKDERSTVIKPLEIYLDDINAIESDDIYDKIIGNYEITVKTDSAGEFSLDDFNLWEVVIMGEPGDEYTVAVKDKTTGAIAKEFKGELKETDNEPVKLVFYSFNANGDSGVDGIVTSVDGETVGNKRVFYTGTPIKTEAIIKDEYTFLKWIGNGGDINRTDNPLEFTISEKTDVNAYTSTAGCSLTVRVYLDDVLATEDINSKLHVYVTFSETEEITETDATQAIKMASAEQSFNIENGNYYKVLALADVNYFPEKFDDAGETQKYLLFFTFFGDEDCPVGEGFNIAKSGLVSGNGDAVEIRYYTAKFIKGDNIDELSFHSEYVSDEITCSNENESIYLSGTSLVAKAIPSDTFTENNIRWNEKVEKNSKTSETQKNKSEDYNTTIEGKTTVDVYAIKDYTISYNANGGEMTDSSAQTYNVKDTSVVLKPAPTRDGYAFAGWKVTTGGSQSEEAVDKTAYFELGKIYGGGKTIALEKAYGNVTLTAQWTELLSLTVAINKDGASWKDNTLNKVVVEIGSQQEVLKEGKTYIKLAPGTEYKLSYYSGSEIKHGYLDANTTVTADFYTVAVSHDDAIDSVSGSGVYAKGTNVEIGAAPKAGYHFTEWDGTYTSNISDYVIKGLSKKVDMTAHGAKDTAALKVIVEVDDSPASGEFINSNITISIGGEAVNYKAGGYTPEVGTEYEVKAKKVDGGSVSATYSGTMESSGATVTIKYYSVTTTKDAGISSTSGDGIYLSGTTNVKVSAVVKSDYRFNGWDGTYTSSDTEYTIANINQTIVMNAHSAKKTSFLNVVVKIDDKTASEEFIKNNVIITIDGEITDYKSDGYAPDTNYKVEARIDVGGGAYATIVDASVSGSDPTTIYVQYYTVTTTPDSGILSTSGDGTYLSGTDVVIGAVPKTGYHFTQWTDDLNGSAAVANNAAYTIEKISNKAKLTAHSAKDTKSLTVTIRKNGNKWTDWNPSADTFGVRLIYSSVSSEQKENTKVYSLEIGMAYTIQAFYQGKLYEVVASGEIATEDKEVFVDYYEVVLNKDAGIKSLTGSGTYLKGADANIKATVKDCYTFENWTDDLNGKANVAENAEHTIKTISSKKEFTANSKANEYTITYNANGGEMTDSSAQTYTVESASVTVKSAPKRKGFDFTGWKVTTGGGQLSDATSKTAYFKLNNAYSGEKTVALDKAYGNVVLTAQWKEIKRTITYDSNGGTINGKDASVSYSYPIGTNVTLIDNIVAPRGKIFMGWAKKITAVDNTTVAEGYIGKGGDKYYLDENTTVYALYKDKKSNDLGITANTIYGTILAGSPFVASATLLNHSDVDVIPSMNIKVLLTVEKYVSEAWKTEKVYTAEGVCVPAHDRNLIMFTVDTAKWPISVNFRMTWSISYDPSSFYDDNETNNVSKTKRFRVGQAYAITNTERPDFQLDPDPEYEITAPEKTSVNTYSWEQWEYMSGSFTKKTYSDRAYAIIILKPENEGGRREYQYGNFNLHNYTTRSGYGFSVHTFSAFSSEHQTMSLRKQPDSYYCPICHHIYVYDEWAFNMRICPVCKKACIATTSLVQMASKEGTLRVTMTYPEFNYLLEAGKATSLVIKEEDGVYKLSMPAYAGVAKEDDAKAHYTPMWFPDGNYRPVTYISGLWTPVGEITATIKQGEYTSSKEISQMYGVYTNNYRIEGSLYDDIYVTR